MGWFRLVNALSKIEARRPKETFFIKITTVVESAVLPQGRAPSPGNDEEKSACDSDSTGWRLERWAQIGSWCCLEKFNFAPFHL